jgi:tetratricopeptide (TPR) repeat protein
MPQHLEWIGTAHDAIQREDFQTAVALFARVSNYLEEIDATEYQEFTDSLITGAQVSLWKLDQPDDALAKFKKVVTHYIDNSDRGGLFPQAIEKFLIALSGVVTAAMKSESELDLLLEFTGKGYEFIRPQIAEFNSLEPYEGLFLAERSLYLESASRFSEAKADLKQGIELLKRHLGADDLTVVKLEARMRKLERSA